MAPKKRRRHVGCATSTVPGNLTETPRERRLTHASDLGVTTSPAHTRLRSHIARPIGAQRWKPESRNVRVESIRLITAVVHVFTNSASHSSTQRSPLASVPRKSSPSNIHAPRASSTDAESRRRRRGDKSLEIMSEHARSRTCRTKRGSQLRERQPRYVGARGQR